MIRIIGGRVCCSLPRQITNTNDSRSDSDTEDEEEEEEIINVVESGSKYDPVEGTAVN